MFSHLKKSTFWPRAQRSMSTELGTCPENKVKSVPVPRSCLQVVLEGHGLGYHASHVCETQVPKRVPGKTWVLKLRGCYIIAAPHWASTLYIKYSEKICKKRNLLNLAFTRPARFSYITYDDREYSSAFATSHTESIRLNQSQWPLRMDSLPLPSWE